MTHGSERYADVDQFIRLCKTWNVETSAEELEHYEKIGAMLPVARAEYPEEFVVRLYHSRSDASADWDWQDEWPSVMRLEEWVAVFPFHYRGLPDENLVHCIDREFEAGGIPTCTVRFWAISALGRTISS